MLGDLRDKGIPEYVTPLFVSKYVDRPVAALDGINFFDQIPYKVQANGQKQYKYDRVMSKLKMYGIEPPERNHPNAKYRPNEIIADLDINKIVYKRLVTEGLIIEQPADEYGKFIYYKDYDKFIRNYVPRKMISYLPSHMNIKDTAAFLGMKTGSLRSAIQRGKADCVWYVKKDGRRRFRWMTKEQIVAFMDKLYDEAKYKASVMLRKTPITDDLTMNLCAVYMKLTTYARDQMLKRKFLVPRKVQIRQTKIINVFDKETVDKLYMILWNKNAYGDYLPYYTRDNIKNKFGKTDFWIDTYVRDACRTMEGKNHQPMTKDERDLDAKKRGRFVASYMGWLKEDVEKVIESGVEVDPVFELKNISEKALDKTNKLELKRRKKEIRENRRRQVMYKPIEDEIELAIRAVMERKQLEREEHLAEVAKKRLEAEAERNQIRRVLGIDEKPTVYMNKQQILANSDTPEIVTIVYSRSGLSIYSKYTHEPTDCIFYARDVTLKVRGVKKKPVFSVFHNIARTARAIAAIPPKVTPAWIVLAAGTSYVNDARFFAKLNEVPAEYGAVAPFGYEHFLPDGSWVNCPNTHGMYSLYSNTNPLKCRRVVGTKSCVGNHEVAVLDGPFVAIRGGFLPILPDLNNFSVLGDGRSYVPYAVSMIMKRLAVKMLQVEIDSSMCADFSTDTNTIDWNAAENMLITFGNRVASAK